MKYVIIQPYFGEFPEWINLFFYSCGKNAKIDFVFFTDCEILPEYEYKNIRFIGTTFEEYCRFVSQRLKIEFKPEYTYKLCDLKPFLGVVHQDIIAKYDCWGYCDFDVVLGDLTPLLEKMHKFDIISTHDDRCSGHFTLIKTESKYTRACFKIWRWKHKLTLPKNKCLDEDDLTAIVSWFLFYRIPLYHRIVRPIFKISKDDYYRITDRLLSVIQSKKVSFEEYYTTPVPNNNSKYTYDTTSGKIFDCVRNIELPYLHFLFFKKTQYLKTDDYWQGNFYHIDGIIKESLSIEFNKKGVYNVLSKLRDNAIE